ncbi:DNA methyltransferase [Bacillus cereus]|uniref:DNA methyltransferase n=1 Tax=Bacillus cereus TaxID=1396 RepID=UPI0015D46F73
MELNKVYNMDCLEGMKQLQDNSVDMILCDLPYGMTDCDWDSIIPLDELWEQYERIIKDGGVIALTGSQPFTSKLVMSRPNKFRHSYIWKKENGTNFYNVNKQPFKIHEDVLIFFDDLATAKRKSNKLDPLKNYFINELIQSGLTRSYIDTLLGNRMSSHYFTKGQQFSFPNKQVYKKLQETGYFTRNYDDLKEEYKKLTSDVKTTYNIQFSKGKPYKSKGKDRKSVITGDVFKAKAIDNEGKRYPTTVLEINRETGLHPTQKPVALFEFLIKTYSNEGDTILDNCMGSGTTAIAAINTNRNFIGFELTKEYYDIANKRIEELKKSKSAE